MSSSQYLFGDPSEYLGECSSNSASKVWVVRKERSRKRQTRGKKTKIYSEYAKRKPHLPRTFPSMLLCNHTPGKEWINTNTPTQ